MFLHWMFFKSYLNFVKICLATMPHVMKVDSVWTAFVETPHPSLKTTTKKKEITIENKSSSMEDYTTKHIFKRKHIFSRTSLKKHSLFCFGFIPKKHIFDSMTKYGQSYSIQELSRR